MNYEVELWIDKGKVKKVMITGVLLFFVLLGAIILAYFLWDEYTYIRTNIKGVSYTGGWPAIVWGWGIPSLVLLTVLWPIMYFYMFDMKKPLLAINKKGILLNKSLFNNCFVEWSEIKELKSDNGKMEILFLNPKEIIEKQSKFSQVFLKEQSKGEAYASFDGTLCEGDFDDFVKKSLQYYNGFNN